MSASVAELEKENRELRRANEILKAASALFAFMSVTRQPLPDAYTIWGLTLPGAMAITAHAEL
jgi:transposase-like protein